MSTAKRLVMVQFDSLENELSAARYEKTVGVFVDDYLNTAHTKINTWLMTAAPPLTLYLGWDGQVYPQFKVIEESLE